MRRHRSLQQPVQRAARVCVDLRVASDAGELEGRLPDSLRIAAGGALQRALEQQVAQKSFSQRTLCEHAHGLAAAQQERQQLQSRGHDLSIGMADAVLQQALGVRPEQRVQS